MSFQISSSVSQSHAAKSYGASLSQSKSLGGIQGNVAAECATWIEDNKDFYQEIMNGTAKVSAQEAQTFLNWWAYAQQTAHGAIKSSNWGDEGGAYSYGQGAAASLPAGAIQGIDGKVVYNEETANITFTGDERPVHVWSNEVNVDISSLSAKVTWEITTDTSINPNEQVMKGVITDGASGKSTVIFVHDFQDATVKTTTPKKNQWSDSTGKVTWAEYTGAKKAENASSNFNVEGEKQEDGSYLFEDATNVQYSSSPLGKDEKGVAKTQISEVYGHLGVDLAPSDKVSVVAGNPKDAKGYTITITHKDGSKDVIYTHQNGKNGYQININGLGAQITFGNTSGENGVPADFKDSFSINGKTSATGKTDEEESTEVQALATSLGIDASEIPEKLRKEIKDHLGYPSQELIAFLVEHDDKLNASSKKWIDVCKSTGWDEKEGEKKILAEAVRDRMVELLQCIYGDKVEVKSKEKDPLAFYLSDQKLRVQAPDGKLELIEE